MLYATGFGTVDHPLDEGSATQSGSLPVLPTVLVGGTSAVVDFAGVVSPGLYQFNVVVPTTSAPGNNLVSVTYAGASTPAGAMIFVQ